MVSVAGIDLLKLSKSILNALIEKGIITTSEAEDIVNSARR